MLAKEVSQKYFKNALTSIHAARANCIFESCWSLTKQAKLTITSLGLHKDGNAYVKHKIKSVDRLVSNSHLHDEIPVVYKEFFAPFLTCSSTLRIIVDWSGCCRKEFHMLRASVVHNGRSITIYDEIHPEEKLSNRAVQTNFLANLYKMIPFGKRVIIVTDAGFATPWFDVVLKLGWNYVGRLKGDVKLKFNDRQRWMKTKNLHKEAKAKPKFIGNAIIGSSSRTPVRGNIYSYKKKPKKRQGESRFPDVNTRYSLSNRTPWILATSLKREEYGKEDVMDLYGKRMEIEQTFRDNKDPRFGFGWRFARNNCMKKIAVLCLLANIAAFFLLSIGCLAEKLGFHRRYQVNSTKKQRVLSLITLAKQILLNGLPDELSRNYKKAIKELIKSSRSLSLC